MGETLAWQTGALPLQKRVLAYRPKADEFVVGIMGRKPDEGLLFFLEGNEYRTAYEMRGAFWLAIPPLPPREAESETGGEG